MLRKPLASPGAVLRDLFASETVLMPGVFNAISAVVAEKSGATALYLSGAGLTNATLGVPDIALATLTEFVDQAQLITAVSGRPILADADTGFGETWNVYRAVHELERSGLAGIHIEDQVMPKRCGHLMGKALIAPQEMAHKIASAVDAKSDPSFVIMARTDARGVEGMEAAIERARRYIDAGCDAIFPEGLESVEEFEQFRAAVPGPLLANMTEFGKTPIIPFSTFRSLGYQMVIYPMTAFRTMLMTLDETYRELLAAGTQAGLLSKMKTRQELYETLDYSSYIARDSSLSISLPAAKPEGTLS